MLGTNQRLRVLRPADMPQVLRLIARDPVPRVFVDYRARLTGMDPQWMNGEMWGFENERRELISVCHAGANLVPVAATPEACAAYARQALRGTRRTYTLVGPRSEIEQIWWHLEPDWEIPREERWDQPHLEISMPPLVAPDPRVRLTRPDEIETLYPACVAMYTEEVGVSPEAHGGSAVYRARIAQLIGRSWSFSRIEEGRVLFKAEVAAVSPYACQIQGVYVDPEYRGRGLATAGMAAVVQAALRDIAPVVSLYVNAHNTGARKAYARVGFRQTHTFATVMF